MSVRARSLAGFPRAGNRVDLWPRAGRPTRCSLAERSSTAWVGSRRDKWVCRRVASGSLVEGSNNSSDLGVGCSRPRLAAADMEAIDIVADSLCWVCCQSTAAAVVVAAVMAASRPEPVARPHSLCCIACFRSRGRSASDRTLEQQ